LPYDTGKSCQQIQLLREINGRNVQITGIHGYEGKKDAWDCAHHIYLALPIRISIVVTIISALDASNWLLMPKSGQMVEISPVYTDSP